tara:strand:- start:129 stop:434 length:306 start_codon:yes stop_codon:yes gene_type:complete
MTRKCDLTGKKSMVGNNVSHANNKTKRKFFPNLQSVSLYSECLETKLSFKIAISTLRTIEKSGGIDKFLIKTDHRYLSTLAKKYKKNILKKITDTAAKISQ